MSSSLVLSGGRLERLRLTPKAREHLIVSRTFVDWLTGRVELDPDLVLAPEDAEDFTERRDRAEALIARIPSFSYSDASLGTRSLEGVQGSLLLDVSRSPSYMPMRGRSCSRAQLCFRSRADRSRHVGTRVP